MTGFQTLYDAQAAAPGADHSAPGSFSLEKMAELEKDDSDERATLSSVCSVTLQS